MRFTNLASSTFSAETFIVANCDQNSTCYTSPILSAFDRYLVKEDRFIGLTGLKIQGNPEHDVQWGIQFPENHIQSFHYTQTNSSGLLITQDHQAGFLSAEGVVSVLNHWLSSLEIVFSKAASDQFEATISLVKESIEIESLDTIFVRQPENNDDESTRSWREFDLPPLDSLPALLSILGCGICLSSCLTYCIIRKLNRMTVSDLETELCRLSFKNNSLADDVATLRNYYRELQEKYMREVNLKAVLEQNYNYLKSEYDKRSNELDEIKGKFQESNQRLKNITSLFEASKKDLLNSTKTLNEKEALNKQLEQMLKQQKLEIEKLKADRIDLESKIQSRDSALEAIKLEFELTKNRQKTTINLQKQTNDTQQSKINELKQQARELAKITAQRDDLLSDQQAKESLIITLKVEIGILTDTIRQSEARLEALEQCKTQIETTHQDLQDQFDSIQQELEAERQSNFQLTTQLNEMNVSFQRIQAQSSRVVIPEGFMDPVNFGIFTDPVVTDSGRSYDQSVITELRNRHLRPTDPITRVRINHVCPNIALRDSIESWIISLTEDALENDPVLFDEISDWINRKTRSALESDPDLSTIIQRWDAVNSRLNPR